MSKLQDKNQVLNYLDLEEKKRAIEERMAGNEKLCEVSIANGKNVEVPKGKKRRKRLCCIKTKIDTLLNSRDEGAIQWS